MESLLALKIANCNPSQQLGVSLCPWNIKASVTLICWRISFETRVIHPQCFLSWWTLRCRVARRFLSIYIYYIYVICIKNLPSFLHRLQTCQNIPSTTTHKERTFSNAVEPNSSHASTNSLDPSAASSFLTAETSGWNEKSYPPWIFLALRTYPTPNSSSSTQLPAIARRWDIPSTIPSYGEISHETVLLPTELPSHCPAHMLSEASTKLPHLQGWIFMVVNP